MCMDTDYKIQIECFRNKAILYKKIAHVANELHDNQLLSLAKSKARSYEIRIYEIHRDQAYKVASHYGNKEVLDNILMGIKVSQSKYDLFPHRLKVAVKQLEDISHLRPDRLVVS